MTVTGPLSPPSLERLFTSLEQHRPELQTLSSSRLADAWVSTVEHFLGDSPDVDALRDELAARHRLSRPGLDAGLDVVLRGILSPAALDIFSSGHPRRPGPGPALVILASNLPGLAAQSLMPALAVRRPLLIKSASAEPVFAPAFLDVLGRHLPAIRRSYAAAAWPGGDEVFEGPIFARAGRIVAYGGGDAVADLRRRATDKLIAHGAKMSVALISRRAIGVDLAAVVRGLARDVALFDQRGCLSVQAVLTDGDAEVLASALGDALVDIASTWPPGTDVAAAAAARQARDAATMRGCFIASTPLGAGTVIVESHSTAGRAAGELPTVEPSPGYRTVTVHAVPSLSSGVDALLPWRGSLQGVAFQDPATMPEPLRRAIEALDVSRIASPGQLQSVDAATWRNGAMAPLDAFL